MFSRYRLVGMVVALVIGLGASFYHRGSTGEEYLAAAKEMVAELPCYKDNEQYVGWLVTDAHDHCFNDSYTMDLSRRSSGGTVDDYRYLTELFGHMIEQAKFDKATQIVTELTALQAKLLSPD